MISKLYLTTLYPHKSVGAFFSGYSENRSKWIDDTWDEKKAWEAC